MAKIDLNAILDLAISKNASDLHISERLPLSLRIDGNLIHYADMGNFSKEQLEVLIKELVTPQKQEQFAKKHEIDFSFQYADGSSFRGNAYLKRGRLALALRLLPRRIRTIEEIGMPGAIYELLKASQGLILVVGPTGSGKSTSMAAMLEYLNQNSVYHIITIEDPIEYIFTNNKCIFSQREIGADTSSYVQALRAALREDPDVVVISEMRDAETMNAAITISETGHLVFGTLHTSGAPHTISRIISGFPAYQHPEVQARIAESLLGVLSQRLVPTKNGKLIAVFELMINNAAAANLIRTGELHQLNNVIQTNLASGMVSMQNSLRDLVSQGVIEENEARRLLIDFES